jgi:hypothetical protein
MRREAADGPAQQPVRPPPAARSGSTPADLEVHLICDNYSTHKHPDIQRWLTTHPRFHMHFTPTYSSWLNQVVRHASRMSAATRIEGGAV